MHIRGTAPSGKHLSNISTLAALKTLSITKAQRYNKMIIKF